MTNYARPGTMGLVPVGGTTGKLIRLGQWLNGDGFQNFEHAFMMLSNGLVLEAEPKAAVIRPFHVNPKDVYWCNNIYKLLPPSTTEAEIDHVAEGLKGTPYSPMDYFALAAHRLDIPFPFCKQYVEASGHMICSQLDDEFYRRLGAHVFIDHRWPGYVTPEALYNRDRQLAK